MTDFSTLTPRTREDAIRVAKEKTAKTGRKWVARDDWGKYYVTPLYEAGREGRQFDAGYAAIGVVVKGSL